MEVKDHLSCERGRRVHRLWCGWLERCNGAQYFGHVRCSPVCADVHIQHTHTFIRLMCADPTDWREIHVCECSIVYMYMYCTLDDLWGCRGIFMGKNGTEPRHANAQTKLVHVVIWTFLHSTWNTRICLYCYVIGAARHCGMILAVDSATTQSIPFFLTCTTVYLLYAQYTHLTFFARLCLSRSFFFV